MHSYRILYLVFFLSGATGLVYEVIWVRLTGLVFGNTSHAISVVLGAFMAGLALGSWRIGRIADRSHSSLRLYGLLEIGIGVSAAAVPFAFRALEGVYWALAPSMESIPGGNALLRFLTSFLVLLVPTFLMGGTLPVLARFFTRGVEEVQRKVGILYALNTFGAACGTLAAALVLIPGFGNLRTTLMIAAINLGIGLFAIAYDRRLSHQVKAAAAPALDVGPARPADAATDRLVLAALGVSGFVSMMYEVAWTRALAALIGSSTYAFSIMLVTFLVGIALGSSLAGKWRRTASLRLLGLTQLGVAAGGFIFLAGYLVAPLVLLSLVRSLYYSFPAVLTTQFLLCALLMVFATICMGAALPIAGHLYSNQAKLLGRSIGSIYSVNTVGAIAGSLTAGFVLLGVIGTERTILAGLFLNSAMALLLLAAPASAKRRDAAKWAALAALIVATLSMKGGVFWDPATLDRGVLIYARQFEARPELTIEEHYEDADVVYFKEGANATISVRRGEDYLGLRTNGKVDASNQGDMMTQLMIGYLPHLYHPAPKSTMIIGYGAGVTVGAATAFREVEEIDCVEIEPAVVGAAALFAPFNRKSYENPKVKIIHDDARTFMNVTRKRYDVIISEPSNPWIAGVGSLFTSEFYDRAAEVLKPDGVFAQWIQLYELDPEDLRMILREFQERFPEVSVWNSSTDLILIGSREPQRLQLSRWLRLNAEDPSVARDVSRYMNAGAPEGLLAHYVMSSEGVRQFASTERRNSDDHPLLEFHAPRQLFRETSELNVDLLYDEKDGLFPEGAEIPDIGKAYSGVIPSFLSMDRPHLASQAMGMLAQVHPRDEALVQVAVARVALDRNDLEDAESALEKAAHAAKPGHPIRAEIEEVCGLVAERRGDDEEAIEHYRAAAAIDPHGPRPLRKLAEIYGHMQAWEEAAHWMERYLATNPPALGHQWAVLGDYYLAGRRADKALEAFEKALEADPYTFWARYRLGRLLEEKNEPAKAIEQYEFSIKHGLDRDPDVYVRLANLYNAAGKTREARAVIEKGFRIFPTNTAVYRLYRQVLEAE